MFGRDPAPSQISAHNIGPGLSRKVREQTLTSREVEVLQLVAGGHSNKLIARALTISEETANSHVKNIIEKLVLTVAPTRSPSACAVASCSSEAYPTRSWAPALGVRKLSYLR